MAIEMENFFRAVLSSEGFPCLATIKPTVSGVNHVVCENLADFFRVLNIQKKACEEKGINLYFCISTLSQRSYIDGEGKTKIRTQANALKTKALILDVDVEDSGEKKGREAYRTQEEARSGIAHLCQTLGIPDPYIVNSGHGLHVYWPFEIAMTAAQWYELASRFKSTCYDIDKRLVADTVRVSDSASLLRVPETYNYKKSGNGDELLPVTNVTIESVPGITYWTYEDYLKQIDGYITKRGLQWQSAIPRRGGDLKKLPKKLVDIEIEYPPVSLLEVIKKCEWMGDYYANRKNEDTKEPVWKAALEIGYNTTIELGNKKLSEEEIAILLSKGHPSYTEENTLKKLSEIQSKDKKLSQRRCDSLYFLNPSACERCKFRPIVSSPLGVAGKSPLADKIIVEKEIKLQEISLGVEQYELPAPPFPFSVGEDGSVYRKIAGEAGAPDSVIKIYENRLIPIQRIKDEDSGNYYVEIELQLPKDGISHFIINNEDFHDEKALIKELTKKGALIEKKNRGLVAEYLIKYARVIQDAQAAVENYESFGWRNRETDDRKFVLYDSLARTDGLYSYRNTSRNLKEIGKHASTKGDINKTIEAIRIYENKIGMEPYVITIMLSFGAPLLAFLNELGFMYNIWGQSGEGKSSSAFIASAIWGAPTESHALKHDTINSMMDKLGIFGNLPMMYDEITTLEGKDLSDFVYAVSNGRAKERMQPHGLGRQVNKRHWQTMVICSSNYSLYGKLGELKTGNNANAYRILEYNAPAPDPEINAQMDGIKESLRNNYGMLGREWAYFIVKNYPRIWESVKLAYANVKEQGTTKDLSKERFWNAAQIIVAVACSFTKELGWHNYDANRLIEYMREMAPRQAVDGLLGDAGSKLNDYLNQNASGVIKIMDDKLVNIDIEAKGANAISARLEGYGGNIVKGYVPINALERWCRSSSTDITWFKTELMRRGVLLRVIKKRIGSGTKFYSLQAHCWELDLMNPYLTGKERDNKETNVLTFKVSDEDAA